ncbi:MAG: HD domain-containing protein [Acidobacteria bacterium]|nr:HD domain-containing protein [Acidobacteriota bacterium]
MTPWRQACEEALRRHSEADAIRAWGFSREASGGSRAPFNYRLEHSRAVVKLARWLCPRVGADLEVVECAAWLHDATKSLGHGAERDCHAQEAAEAAEAILEGTDFPRGKVEAVRSAIRHHVGLRLAHRLEPLEAAVLWDCDKLSKIGAASLVHFTCVAGAFQAIETGDILRRGQAWLDLAEGIAESMNTEPARIEAGRRLEFLKRHYEQLAREWADPTEPCPT